MKQIPPSELIINADGSIFHLHLKPEHLAERVILVGDPARVSVIGNYLDNRECDIENREFHSITGSYRGKRITVVSHGIGCDNMDIVVNELDALANIDFGTRSVKPAFRQLAMVRIGTSGGLQPFAPVGSFVVAEYSIGLDGVIYFYDRNLSIRDVDFEEALLRQLGWCFDGLRPYVVRADASLVEQIAQDDMLRGVTIAANGFYGPQGRTLRLSLYDPALNAKIEAVEYRGRRITNFEMESSALAGLAALMGHRAMTACCIIAGRADHCMNVSYKDSLTKLIEKVLERI
ncbi:MAG: nucleoside phosphorylase [Tannerella sp.]|jgi:uridine phosphorylase|nr:nucleoside phosphorylase [Tannerella sp.]